MIKIKVKSFEQLTKLELYYLLQLRSEVFVVEQDCVYQDLDGKDKKIYYRHFDPNYRKRMSVEDIKRYLQEM